MTRPKRQPSPPLSFKIDLDEPATKAELRELGAGAGGRPQRKLTDAEVQELYAIVAELERRDSNTLKLYKPLPTALDLHASLAKEIIAFGGNRASKTTSCLMQTAMIILGQHPVLSGKRYGTPTTNGRAAIVGKTLSHIGRVIYPKLFLPGAIKMIRDKPTGRWRAWLGWKDPDYPHREHEVVDAPPIIPPEMVMPKGTAWLKSREGIPKRIILRNGWEIYFYSSEGKPPRGDDYNLVHIDEELIDPSWLPEMTMRVGTRHGFVLWSATGQDGGEEMFEVYERARCQAEAGDPNPRTQAFFFLPEDNPYYPKEELEIAKEKLRNRPDEYAARILGRFLNSGFRVYPDFDIRTHGFDAGQLDNNRVPDNWARWVAVDPGRQTCAALFLAMPPSGHMVLAYDEIYIHQCTAQAFGDAMAKKMRDQFFEAVVIDSKAAMVHEMTTGITREKYYWDAMAKHKLWERVRCKSFIYGDTDVAGGIEAVHNWLHIEGTTGKPYLRVLRERLPALEGEFSRYSYLRDGKDKKATDKPNARSDSHLMDAVRYLAQYQPRYRAPEKAGRPRSTGGLMYDQIKKSMPRKSGSVAFAPSGRISYEPIIVSA